MNALEYTDKYLKQKIIKCVFDKNGKCIICNNKRIGENKKSTKDLILNLGGKKHGII